MTSVPISTEVKSAPTPAAVVISGSTLPLELVQACLDSRTRGVSSDEFVRAVRSAAVPRAILDEFVTLMLAAVKLEACGNHGCESKRVTALKRCAKCRSVGYCSVACQKAAWPTHKPACHTSLLATLATAPPDASPEPNRKTRHIQLADVHVRYQSQRGSNHPPLVVYVKSGDAAELEQRRGTRLQPAIIRLRPGFVGTLAAVPVGGGLTIFTASEDKVSAGPSAVAYDELNWCDIQTDAKNVYVETMFVPGGAYGSEFGNRFKVMRAFTDRDRFVTVTLRVLDDASDTGGGGGGGGGGDGKAKSKHPISEVIGSFSADGGGPHRTPVVAPGGTVCTHVPWFDRHRDIEFLIRHLDPGTKTYVNSATSKVGQVLKRRDWCASTEAGDLSGVTVTVAMEKNARGSGFSAVVRSCVVEHGGSQPRMWD